MKKLILIVPVTLNACTIFDPALYDSNIPVVENTAVNQVTIVKEAPLTLEQIEAERKAEAKAAKEAQVQAIINKRERYRGIAKRLIREQQQVDLLAQACNYLQREITGDEGKRLMCWSIHPLSDVVFLSPSFDKQHFIGNIRIFDVVTDGNNNVTWFRYMPQDRYLLSALIAQYGKTSNQWFQERCKVWPYEYDEHIANAKNAEEKKVFKDIKADMKNTCLKNHNTWGV